MTDFDKVICESIIGSYPQALPRGIHYFVEKRCVNLLKTGTREQ